MTEVASTSSPVIATQSLISEQLRNEIIDGKRPPGGRLPTQLQLVERFRVSGVTIQRVIHRLSREGFLRTRGRNGTFVATYPPHLFSYGIVFHDQLTPGQHRSRFHEVLESAAMQMQRSDHTRVTIFSGIAGYEGVEESRRLLNMLRMRQMAGLLLIDGEVSGDMPLVAEPSICRAAIMSCRVEAPNCPIVYPDLTGMIDLGLDRLLAQGRRRIATLISVPVYQHLGHYLRQAMQARGISNSERWLQIVPHDIPEAARNSVRLMMASGQECPDGLFILDDNLTDGASEGLLASGVCMPADLAVFAHCNMPCATPARVPLQMLCFDTRQILDKAISLIDMQRRGQPVPVATAMSAMVNEPSEAA